eukprot:7863064-Pyramimonas_sp.AAC.1
MWRGASWSPTSRRRPRSVRRAGGGELRPALGDVPLALALPAPALRASRALGVGRCSPPSLQ